MQIQNFKKSFVVYAIKCNVLNKTYIGNTSNLTNRLANHISSFKSGKSSCYSKYVLEHGNYMISVLKDNIFAQIEGQFEDAIRNTEEAIELKLKERPEIRSRIDTRTAIRLTRFEGSASNVLRDVLITTSNMAEEIKNKRIVLQESLKNDDKLKKSMKNDNVLIIDYFKELGPIPEIEKVIQNPLQKFLIIIKLLIHF